MAVQAPHTPTWDCDTTPFPYIYTNNTPLTTVLTQGPQHPHHSVITTFSVRTRPSTPPGQRHQRHHNFICFAFSQQPPNTVRILETCDQLTAGQQRPAHSTWRMWQGGNWLAAVVVGAVSAATLVFAGEEIGWGQI